MSTKETADTIFKMATEKKDLTSKEKDALWAVISLLNDKLVSEDFHYGKF